MTPIIAGLSGGGIFAIVIVLLMLFVAWQLRHHHRPDGKGPGGKP